MQRLYLLLIVALLISCLLATDINVDPSNRKGQFLPSTVFGVGSAALWDNNAAICSDPTFISTAQGLKISLLRANWGQGGGSIMDRIFPTSTSSPNWNVISNYVQNVRKFAPDTRQLITIGWPGWFNPSDNQHRLIWARMVVQVAQYFHNSGVPCMYYEMCNENDGLDMNDFNACFNAMSATLKQYNSSIKAGGTTDSYAHGDRFQSFLKSCRPDFLSYHWYGFEDNLPVQQGKNNGAVMSQAAGAAQEAVGVHNIAVAAGVPNIPIFLGEYNLDGYWYSGVPDFFSGGIMTTHVNAVAMALLLYRHIEANINVEMAALWEMAYDSDYGIVNGNRVLPVGYFLSKAAATVYGPIVASTPTANIPNFAVIATVPRAGTFSVLLINYDLGSSQTISLNVRGVNGNVDYWEIGSRYQRQPNTKVISAGGLSNLDIPPLSVVIVRGSA